MNRKRIILGLLVAVVIGLLASSFVYRQVTRPAAARVLTTNQIVVAAERLPLGTRLKPSQVRQVSWPSEQPMSGMFMRSEDVFNRALITSVAENEPILEAKLAPLEAGAGLPAAIPEGMRALTVAVNDVVGVAGFVGPGTMVDVLVTGSTGAGAPGGAITRAVLENIRVMAAGQKVEQDKDGKPQTVSVITLLVTPEEANKLAMASTQGKIQLALRNTVDSKKVDPPAILQASLFGGAAPVAKPIVRRGAPAPPPVFTVEIITGSKRETKSFSNSNGGDHGSGAQ